MKRLALTILAAGAAFASSPAVAAPLAYSGGAYTQNFDGLPVNTTDPGIIATITGRGPHDINGSYVGPLGTLTATGMEGWTMSNNAGSSTNTEYRTHNGSVAGSSGRGVISLGTTNASDRALGTLATSNQISRFGVAFLNASATTYNSFEVGFTVEQWRQGGEAVVNSNNYDYAVTSNSLDDINADAIFTNYGSYGTPNPFDDLVNEFGELNLDGNLPANQIAVTDGASGFSWAPGQWLILRWNGQDVTGQDNALAIDNLSFSATVVPEPAGLVLVALGAAAAGLRRRR